MIEGHILEIHVENWDMGDEIVSVVGKTADRDMYLCDLGTIRVYDAPRMESEDSQIAALKAELNTSERQRKQLQKKLDRISNFIMGRD